MIELYFLLIRLPRMMSRLARERNRSAVGWSLLAIAAWIGSEILVVLIYSIIYETGIEHWGWPEQPPLGVVFVVYLLSLASAILGAAFIRRVLRSIPVSQPLPPPPPQF